MNTKTFRKFPCIFIWFFALITIISFLIHPNLQEKDLFNAQSSLNLYVPGEDFTLWNEDKFKPAHSDLIPAGEIPSGSFLPAAFTVSESIYNDIKTEQARAMVPEETSMESSVIPGLLLLWFCSVIFYLYLIAMPRIRHQIKNLNFVLIGIGIYFAAVLSIFTLFFIGELQRPIFVWFMVFSILIPILYATYLVHAIVRSSEIPTERPDKNRHLSDEKFRREQENKRMIESQNEKLTEELNARTAELAEAYEKLKQSNEELENTRKQLIQQEKMASLGQLTAGIAHEIKNPLNFVNNFSEVSRELIDELREELEKNRDNPDFNIQNSHITEILDDIEANVATINRHGQRADSIVQGMLLHSRGKSGEKIPTDINKLLDEYADLAYHGMRAKDPGFNAVIEKEFDESIGKMDVVPQDISRAFLNIINNGLQASAEYHQKNNTGIQTNIRIITEKSDDSVKISIADNGPGIPKSIKKKIFEPFFTTKDAGEGTGLGLSMTYDIIKSHNGSIEIKTGEHEGTTFIIELPLR